MWNDLLVRNQQSKEDLAHLGRVLKVLEKNTKKDKRKPRVVKVRTEGELKGLPITGYGVPRKVSFTPRPANQKYPWNQLSGAGDYFDWPFEGTDYYDLASRIATAGRDWFKRRGIKVELSHESHGSFVRVKLLSWRKFSEEEIEEMKKQAEEL